ncbi:FAD-linked oxidase C-terminal domain-containing protein [Leisingera sp. ANG-M1]
MPLDQDYGDPVKRQFMTALKKTFDPLSVMNPGKVVSGRADSQ